MFSPICVRVYSKYQPVEIGLCTCAICRACCVFAHWSHRFDPPKIRRIKPPGRFSSPNTHMAAEVIRLPIFRTNYYPVPSAARLCEILYWMFHSGRQMVLSVVNIPTLCGVASGSRTSGSLQTNYRAYSFFTAVQMVFSANDRMSWRL